MLLVTRATMLLDARYPPRAEGWAGPLVMVRLLPGQSSEIVVETLWKLTFEVSNLSTAGQDKFERLNAYLRWVSETAEILGRQLHPADLSRLLTTPRYWSILGIDPAAHDSAALHALLRLELDERKRALESAHAELRLEVRRWKGLSGKVVCPDTNFYCHHTEQFDEVDWRSLIGTADQVHVVIPLVVIDELDDRKQSPRNKFVHEGSKTEVRTRARTTLRALNRLLQTTAESGLRGVLADGTSVDYLQEDPLHTRLDDNDTEIVDVVADLMGKLGRDVTVLTQDTGMALRARTARVPCHLFEA